MAIIYIAQANISLTENCILKGEAIAEEVYNSLPERLKIKFRRAASSSEPAARNEIIGDNDIEKAKREQLEKKDSKAVQTQSENKLKFHRNRRAK